MCVVFRYASCVKNKGARHLGLIFQGENGEFEHEKGKGKVMKSQTKSSNRNYIE